jgi:hypothetical protein
VDDGRIYRRTQSRILSHLPHFAIGTKTVSSAVVLVQMPEGVVSRHALSSELGVEVPEWQVVINICVLNKDKATSR